MCAPLFKTIQSTRTQRVWAIRAIDEDRLPAYQRCILQKWGGMMKRMIVASVIVIAVGCCGGPQEETTTTSSTHETGENSGEGQETSTPVHVLPENPPAVEGEQRSALIALLREHINVNPDDFSEQMGQALHPGRLQPLVGMTRDELIAQLGEPNAEQAFQGEGQVAWQIGAYPEPRLAHPPVLVATLDASGVVTEANFQLSM